MKRIITLLLLVTSTTAKPQTVLDPPSPPMSPCDSLVRECEGFIDTLVSMQPLKRDYVSARERVLTQKITAAIEDNKASEVFDDWLGSAKEYVSCYYTNWNGCDKQTVKLRLAANETKFKMMCMED